MLVFSRLDVVSASAAAYRAVVHDTETVAPRSDSQAGVDLDQPNSTRDLRRESPDHRPYTSHLEAETETLSSRACLARRIFIAITPFPLWRLRDRDRILRATIPRNLLAITFAAGADLHVDFLLLLTPTHGSAAAPDGNGCGRARERLHTYELRHAVLSRSDNQEAQHAHLRVSAVQRPL